MDRRGTEDETERRQTETRRREKEVNYKDGCRNRHIERGISRLVMIGNEREKKNRGIRGFNKNKLMK